MGLITYDDLADRLDAVMATILRGTTDDDRSPAEPLALDPYDYAFQEDPYPVYAWLREHEPLHHNATLDLWALTRHADIAEAVRTEGTYSNSWGVAIEESAWGPDAHKVMSILGMDPPRQKRLRSLVSRGFTPRRVHDLLPRIQQLTDRYLAECLEMGAFDWITDFAGKLPMDVISEMMGVPEEDRAEVRRQADIVVHREDGVYDVPPAGDGRVALAGRLLPGHGRRSGVARRATT